MSDYLFECKSLKKSYGKKRVLNGFDLQITKGKVVGLLGVNGCGKSTLLKIACGLTTKSDGEIYIDGISPSLETKKIVSYLPDKSFLSEFVLVKDSLKFFEDFFDDFDKNKAIIMLKNLNISLNEKITTLSKGTKEKLQLILIMSRNVKLYLLDEPIAAVDPASRDYIIETFLGEYNKDATVIITTHLIQDIERLFDEVVLIKDGQDYLHTSVEDLRKEKGMSVNSFFREVFKC